MISYFYDNTESQLFVKNHAIIKSSWVILKRFMKTKLKRFWQNEFYQGGFLFTAASFFAGFLGYLFNFFSAHGLGPSGYGEVTALLSYNYISLVPLTVFATLIIQKISGTANRVGAAAMIEEFFLRKVKQRWFLGLPFIILLPFLPSITNLSSLMAYSIIPLFLLAFLGAFYSAALQGLRLFKLLSLITIITAFLKLLGAVLTLTSLQNLSIILVFLFVSVIFMTVSSYQAFHRYLQKYSPSPNLTKINQRLRYLILKRPFLITTISLFALTLFNNVDILMVKKFFSGPEAGIYSAWALLAKIMFYAVSPILSVSFIFFASVEKSKHHQKTLWGIMIGLGLIGGVNYLFYWLFPSFIISLFFGVKFQAAAFYLAYAAIFGSLYTLITFINYYFIAQKSLAALISFLVVPIYVLSLFLVEKKLMNVINVNLIFAGGLLFLYLLALIRLVIKKH